MGVPLELEDELEDELELEEELELELELEEELELDDELELELDDELLDELELDELALELDEPDPEPGFSPPQAARAVAITPAEPIHNNLRNNLPEAGIMQESSCQCWRWPLKAWG